MSRRLYPGWGSGSTPFVATFPCFPLAYCAREDAEMGNRVILPQEALRDITRLKLPFPLFFALNPTKKAIAPSSGSRGQNTAPSRPAVKKKPTKFQQYCSVLEFSSQDGSLYVPLWMFEALRVKEGGLVHLESVLNVPKGTFCQFQVESPDFFVVSQRLGAKALLESTMRSYASLAEGSRILVQHAGEAYFLKVIQCKPAKLISVLGNVDLEVDFVPPENFVPDETKQQLPQPSKGAEAPNSHSANTSSHDRITPISSAFDRCTIGPGEGNREQEEGPTQEEIMERILASEEDAESGDELPRKTHADKNSAFFGDPSKGHSLLATPRTQQSPKDRENSAHGGSSSPPRTGENVSPSRQLCSTCHRAIPKSGFQMHEIHCARNFYTCDLCSQVVRKADRLKHNDEEHTVYNCEDCHLQISQGGRQALERHMAQECRCRLAPCQYCRAEHQASSLEFHEIECGAALVPCAGGCGESIARKDVAAHVCKVACGQCGETMAASALHRHEKFACAKAERVCEYCSVSQSSENFDRHRAYCGNRSDACESCGSFVRLSQMKEHEISGCQIGATKALKRRTPQAEAELKPSSYGGSTSDETIACPHCGAFCLDAEEFQVHCLTQCKVRNRSRIDEPAESVPQEPLAAASGTAFRHRPSVAQASKGRTSREVDQRRKPSGGAAKTNISNRLHAKENRMSGNRNSRARSGASSAAGKDASVSRSTASGRTAQKHGLLTRGKTMPLSRTRGNNYKPEARSSNKPKPVTHSKSRTASAGRTKRAVNSNVQPSVQRSSTFGGVVAEEIDLPGAKSGNIAAATQRRRYTASRRLKKPLSKHDRLTPVSSWK